MIYYYYELNQNIETASVANYESDGRLNAPSAIRNAKPIVELVKKTAIKSGNALEIASGTGYVVKLVFGVTSKLATLRCG